MTSELALKDRLEIEDLLSAYVLNLDVDDTEATISLFAEDSEFRVYGRTFSGHEGLRGMLTGAPKGSHLSGRSLITPDGDGARVRSQLVFFPADRTEHRLTVYDDVVVKVNDTWLFKVRECRFMDATGTLGPRP